VKAIVSFADTSSSCDGDAMTKIAGAKVNLVDADRIETAGGMFTAISVGAKIVKADNIVFEAESAITLVMGASLLSIPPLAWPCSPCRRRWTATSRNSCPDLGQLMRTSTKRE
jgi:hypothetical protein